MSSMINFLDSASSAGVRESALPMTGMTLTRGESRFMSSMSSSRRLCDVSVRWPISAVLLVDVPVTGRCDEVEKDVNTVVAESRVALDARLLCENVIVLSLEITNNLGETKHNELASRPSDNTQCPTHLNSLSI